jgi:hypothetical protein
VAQEVLVAEVPAAVEGDVVVVKNHSVNPKRDIRGERL